MVEGDGVEGTQGKVWEPSREAGGHETYVH